MLRFFLSRARRVDGMGRAVALGDLSLGVASAISPEAGKKLGETVRSLISGQGSEEAPEEKPQYPKGFVPDA